MEYKLEANGIHIVCSSPLWAQTMIDRGARLIEPSQAEELRKALEIENVRTERITQQLWHAR
jgi:hypothetical protein